MATETRIIAGSDLALYVGDVMIGCADEVSVSRSTEMNSAVCKATGAWSATSPGTLSWTASASGIVKYYATAEAAANVGITDLKAHWRNKTKITLRFSTSVAGDEGEEGEAYITSVEETAGSGGATYSVSFEGTGPLDPIVVPA